MLAMVIEKATGEKIYDYFEESFWQPLGSENETLWQVDSEANDLVKAYCCVASNAKDFARYGKLFKDHGKWNGKQILDSAFVAKSVTPRFKDNQIYGYGWWLANYKNKDIFYMRGHLGQLVIVIPEDDLIVVRLGHTIDNSRGDDHSPDFYTFIDEAYTMMEK